MDSSKKRIALAIAAVCLSAAMVVLLFLIKDTRANLLYGDGADVDLGMSDLKVQLEENGSTVKDGGKLLGQLKDVSVDPGYTYSEKITAKNAGNVDEYVRIIVKKYWTDGQDKRVDLDPSLIKFSYEGKDYNTDRWVIDPSQTTSEQAVYYYRMPLGEGEKTAPLFDGVKVDASIADKFKVSESGKKITAEYDYNDLKLGADMTVQGVQTADGPDAVRSTWGNEHVNVENGVVVIE